jgi:hypothetical protein
MVSDEWVELAIFGIVAFIGLGSVVGRSISLVFVYFDMKIIVLDGIFSDFLTDDKVGS